MKKTILSKDLIEQLEKEDFTINEYPEENSIEFQKYSDAGQDFSFTVSYDDDYEEMEEIISDLAENVYEYYQNFNPCEEALLWVDDEGYGKNGAPDLEDCIEDMKCCEQFILDVYNILTGDFVSVDDGKYKYKMTLEGINTNYKNSLEFVTIKDAYNVWDTVRAATENQTEKQTISLADYIGDDTYNAPEGLENKSIIELLENLKQLNERYTHSQNSDDFWNTNKTIDSVIECIIDTLNYTKVDAY